jgi:colanic acid/amylovoran biosynthesis glycosyltransferase
LKKKGCSYRVEAFDRLRDKGIKFDCRIVGDGPDQETLERLVREKGLGESVQLVGPQSQSRIVDLLEESSLFVLPAIHDRNGDSDNLPTVLIEALASSLPAVATDVAGIPEIVQHGTNGFLVPEKDSIALASAIASMSGDLAKLRTFGAASRQIAEKTFAQEITVKQLKRLFAANQKSPIT